MVGCACSAGQPPPPSDRVGSIGVILTSPPYWVKGGAVRRQSATRTTWPWALGVNGRVLAPDGDLWLVIGDRHDGAEWVGMERARHRLAPSHRLASSVARLLGPNRLPGALGQPRQLSPALQESRAGRAPARNHAVLDLTAAAFPPGQHLGRDPRPVVRTVLEGSKKRGPVLDPFAGAGTVGRVVASLGREWVGVELDPRMARLTARRLRLKRLRPTL